MPIPIEQELGQILMLASADFQRRLDADLAERGCAGIRSRHRAVFLHLGRFGPSRAVDLAEAAGIRPQSMTKIVQELEQLGLVRRRPDPGDSRAKLVEFTGSGLHRVAELSQSTAAVWGQYEGLLGGRKLLTTFRSLKTLLARSQEELADE